MPHGASPDELYEEIAEPHSPGASRGSCHSPTAVLLALPAAWTSPDANTYLVQVLNPTDEPFKALGHTVPTLPSPLTAPSNCEPATANPASPARPSSLA